MKEQIAKELAELVGMCPSLPDAKWQHNTLMAALTKAGWDVRKEVGSQFFDGVYHRNGRVDLYAVRDGFRIAIEIDRKSPRTRSVLKLREIDADLKLIIVRQQGFSKATPGGVDRVLCVGTLRGKGALLEMSEMRHQA